MHNFKIYCEVSSADEEAAYRFPDNFTNLKSEKGYLPEQIFNVDETSLFWKKMPARSYISKQTEVMPGFKVANNRLTIILGGNSAGDMKLKLLVVYRCRKPQAFKNIHLDSLPVVWKCNSKAWVMRSIFTEWYS